MDFKKLRSFEKIIIFGKQVFFSVLFRTIISRKVHYFGSKLYFLFELDFWVKWLIGRQMQHLKTMNNAFYLRMGSMLILKLLPGKTFFFNIIFLKFKFSDKVYMPLEPLKSVLQRVFRGCYTLMLTNYFRLIRSSLTGVREKCSKTYPPRSLPMLPFSTMR